VELLLLWSERSKNFHSMELSFLWNFHIPRTFILNVQKTFRISKSVTDDEPHDSLLAIMSHVCWFLATDLPTVWRWSKGIKYQQLRLSVLGKDEGKCGEGKDAGEVGEGKGEGEDTGQDRPIL